jgi:Superinfection immunity protein
VLTLIGLTLLYFLPTIVGRHKHDALGIFVINLLFGWTMIGWIIALLWACAAEPCVPVHYLPVMASGRFCCQCGSLSPAGAHFCPGCGHVV